MAGLIHINTVNQTTGAATVALTGATANTPYLVTMTNLKTANNVKNPRFRLTKTSDSSADATAEYDSVTKTFRTDTTFNYGGGADGTSHSLGNIGTGSNQQEAINGFLYFYNLVDAAEYTYHTTELCYIHDSEVWFGQIGGGVHTVAQSHNGISFFEGSGDNITGKFSLYQVVT